MTCATAVSICLTPLGVASATAEPPPTPAAEFTAPTCPGTTEHDPTDAAGPVADLTEVFGRRLDAYNEGRVVPLYDYFGDSQGAFPPLCGVRYDATVAGPVSQWMFCTDIKYLACGGVDALGNIIEEDRANTYPVDPMEDLPTNPKLDADQEKLISYLVQQGHSYAGVGAYSLGGVDRATADLGSDERRALQTLIWCISDPDVAANVPDFAATCAANMDAAEQARLLTMIPDVAVLQLQFVGDLPDLEVGATARFRITTNVYNQPIQLVATPAGPVSVRVCSGDATLAGTTLTVAGDDPQATSDIEVCVTTTESGTVSLNASAQPPSTQHILWAQSPTRGPHGQPCQVFANFSREHQVTTSTRAQVRFVAGPKAAPRLRTRVTDAHVRPGATLRDRVQINALATPYQGIATARLYGPYSTKPGAADCRKRDLVATVRFNARNGTMRTPGVKVSETGYYTWVASLSGDRLNEPASHRCGLASETTLVQKRQVRHTIAINSGFEGRLPTTALMRVAHPSRLTFEAAGVAASVMPVGMVGHSMAMPGSTHRLGRLTRTAAPGDKIGTAVIAGHISDDHNVPGAMWGLKRASRGDVFSYTQPSGATQRYRVVSVRSYVRGRLPQRMFNTGGRPRVALVTCSGIKVTGRHFHYTRNLVVMGVPIG